MPTTAELSDRYWELTLTRRPSTASLLGFHDYDHHIEEPTEDASRRHASGLRTLRAELDATSSDNDPLTRTLLAASIDSDITEEETGILIWPVDPNIGIHSEALRLASQTKALEPEHAEALAQRYRQIPSLLEQALARHRRLASEGRPPAAVSVRRVMDQVDSYVSSDLSNDSFVGIDLPEGWDGADRWRSDMEEIVTGLVRPAYAAYRQGLADHILPVARPDEQAGICHLEGGEEIYRRLVERFVTVPYDPAEIHRIGDHHVRETLVGEYAEPGTQALGTADLGTLFRRLREDPEVRYSSADEMLDHARETVARAWAAIDGWLGARPDSPCQVMALPESLAKDMPPAMYMPPSPDGSRPGTYLLNTYRPEERDRFMAEATAFHEAIPGHHFDRALATALTDLPDFRRFSFYNVHVEGWGLYSERLADEMGLYSGSLDRIGMLTADSWRAARLVVDTGMHFHGWSRQQAVQYLTDWTPIALPTIEQEIDRYIGWPGQALSYKMGQIEINRLRRQAERELGDRFDVAGFHDVVLTSGSVTMPVLADLVETWVSGLKGGEGGI